MQFRSTKGHYRQILMAIQSKWTRRKIKEASDLKNGFKQDDDFLLFKERKKKLVGVYRGGEEDKPVNF